MLLLIANLGSTSFKYKLFESATGKASDLIEKAVGAADRIGLGNSEWSMKVGSAAKVEGRIDLHDHAAAIELHLSELVIQGAIRSISDINAVGYKAVHGGPISGAVKVDDNVLAIMEQFADVAPQHNPPYIAAMKAFAEKIPGLPQVAAFETAFHQTIPPARQVYGIPHKWVNELGIRRYGFHGASHRYIATRMKEILPQARKIISCHLGGSCSICAIEDGKSVANSFGMTAQSGTFHASRVGDFDVFALLKLLKAGQSIDSIFKVLGKESGLLGLSGVSSDMRVVEQAAAEGNKQAQLALDAFVETVRHYVAAYLGVLNGADAIVFTGGIGQFGREIRRDSLANFDYAGIALDPAKNMNASGKDETRIDNQQGRTQVWVLPTNEELIVARQTLDVLAGN